MRHLLGLRHQAVTPRPAQGRALAPRGHEANPAHAPEGDNLGGTDHRHTGAPYDPAPARAQQYGRAGGDQLHNEGRMPDNTAPEAQPFTEAHARIKAVAAPAVAHVMASIPKANYNHAHVAFKGK